MGLDMYGYTMNAEFAAGRQTDVMPTTEEERKQLEDTPGFFFGGEEIYPEDIEETKKFIAAARAALANGLAVFYDSWW